MPLLPLLLATVSAEPVVLIDVTAPDQLTNWRANHTSLRQIPNAEGRTVLEVTFAGGVAWPNVYFAAGQAYSHTDWREHGALAVTVTNPGDAPVTLWCRIDDDPSADGSRHCRQGSCEIPAGETITIQMDLAAAIPGMRGQPPSAPGSARFSTSAAPLDLSHIIAFQLFLAHPTEDRVLRISRIELTEATPRTAFVDRFGQYNGADWPGKIHGEDEFAARRTSEEEDLTAHPGPAGRDAWGGWAGGPQLPATGRFRTARVDGKWWLVDPDGRLFWSAGVDCVRPKSEGPIRDRHDLFTWLPEPDSPLAAYVRNDWADFYAMNLHRKYGPDYEPTWRDISHRRLRSWGFNTIGNWSDDAVCNDRRTPYTVAVHYGGPVFETGYGRGFPDVFSDEWAARVDTAMADRSKDRTDDPWCIGYFIDNELMWGPWGGGRQPLATALLKSPQESASRARLHAFLRERFGTVAALNAKWGTAVESWEALGAGLALDANQHQAAGDDLSAFETLLAERYFEVCRDAVRRHAPGALYLGCRFAAWSTEAVTVSGRYCDVVCFNIYHRSPLARRDAISLIDAPVVIGEFHFGALDRGMFHTGLVPTGSQDERAAAFEQYLREAIAAPWCVGAHWFQYSDQALTGRFDGENYNIGFVTITDTPYPEMVAAARRVGEALYTIRSTAR